MTGKVGRPRKPHKPKTAWRDVDKIRAVTIFKSVGNVTKTVDLTGVPYETLHQWMKQPWWTERLNQLKAEDTAELEDAATSIAKQAADVVRDRLANGDSVFNRDGELVKKPVGGRDAAIIMGISMQKRKELQDLPQRAEQLGTAERLLKLVEQFARFANAKEIKGVLANAEALEVKEDIPPSIFSAVEKDINAIES